jgi:outer membrane PBP1 activator LpoA protein
MNRAHHLACSFALAIFLSACGSAPSKPDQTSTAVSSPDNDIVSTLKLAQNSSGDQALTLLLDAAEAALQQEQWQQLRTLLANISLSNQEDEILVRYALLTSSLQQHDNDNSTALTTLSAPNISVASTRISAPLKSQYLLNIASLHAKLGQVPPAINALLARSDLLAGSERLANQQRLWQYLLLLDKSELDALSTYTSNQRLKGWLTLASLYRDGDADITLQAKSLEDWQRQWRDHEANSALPGGLQKLIVAAKQIPSKVLVLLPTSGPLAIVGTTIRDGILFAYWQQQSAGLPTPKLTFIDSEPLDSTQLLELISKNNPDVVIGPFNKEKATALARQATALPNTLLLNIINEPNPSDNIVTFGLNPEDESAQVADRAILESGTRALVIAPNNTLGDRLQTAFIDRWLALGGTISDIGRYEDGRDLSNTIKNALNIDKSEMRKRRLALNTGLTLQFEPRRRQDIDTAAMFGKPQEARSIGPLFAFHYAQDIPLYTSSLAYTGQPDSQADKDLEGVRFNDIPWILNSGTNNTATDTRFKRLFALGIDAYKLHQRFEVLDPEDGMQIQGATGRLSLNAQRQVTRQLDWAIFDNGLAKPLPAIK